MAASQQLSKQEREELDERAKQGETVLPGDTRGKSLEAQEQLAEGRSRGGQTRKEQLGAEGGYREMGKKGGQATGRRGGADDDDLGVTGDDDSEAKVKPEV